LFGPHGAGSVGGTYNIFLQDSSDFPQLVASGRQESSKPAKRRFSLRRLLIIFAFVLRDNGVGLF